MNFYNSLKAFAVVAFFILTSLTCSENTPKPAPQADGNGPAPTEIESSASLPTLPTEPTYSEIKKLWKTGDVLIFKEYDPAGLAIALVEEELGRVPGYTHVGIVFDLPATDSLPAGLYLWQAIPPKDVFPQTYGNDYFKNAESNGAQMVSMDKVMAFLSTLKGLDTEYISWRKLSKPLSDAEKKALENYARTVDGRSFSHPATVGMATDYLEGRAGKQSDDNSFFCSKLASQTFYKAGLIDSVVTNSVLPGHFAISPGDKHNLIQFKNNSLDSIVQFLPQ